MDLPQKLYSLLKEQNPKESKRVLREINDDLREILINLILKVSAGNQKIEKDLAEAFLADLDLLATIRDVNFFNHLLMPLIKNERTLPVALFEKWTEPKNES